jgi:hypothetical protein
MTMIALICLTAMMLLVALWPSLRLSLRLLLLALLLLPLLLLQLHRRHPATADSMVRTAPIQPIRKIGSKCVDPKGCITDLPQK